MRKKTVNKTFAWKPLLDELSAVAADQIGDTAQIESVEIAALKDGVTVTVNRNDARIVLHFNPDDPYPVS